MNYTKQLLLIPLLVLLAITGNAQNFGSFASGVFIRQNGTLNTYNLTGDGTPNEIGPGGPGFNGSLGTFAQNSGSLVLAGAEVKTFKNPGANVCMPTLNYRIRPNPNGTNTYSNLPLPFKANCTGNVFDGDVTWSNGTMSSALIDIPAGTYTATCTVNGCTSPASDPVTVTEAVLNPPVLAATTNTVCPGATATLSASGCNGDITWSTGDAGASIDAPAGTYSATCTIRLGGGRFSPACTSAPSDEITINETQVLTPTISGFTTVCPGGTTTLFADGCNGDVTWSDGTMSSALIDIPAGTYTATCTVNGCTSPASDPVTVTEILQTS